MNTKQMEYIIELAQTLNFNRAAENLYISQPTLTYQIKAVEGEIGFAIFERSGKGAMLTPAGAQFVSTLRTVYGQLKAAIEQGQNFSAKYAESIRMALPIRSAIYFLPQVMTQFSHSFPDVTIIPSFDWQDGQDSFLRGEQDITFAMEYTMKRVPDVTCHHLFDSRIYLITEKNDRLTKKPLVAPSDLKGRTLMVGGGSPPALRALQQRMIQEIHVDYFNSPDHDNTLTNVAAHRGVCLAPGFLNDHNGEFAWLDFDSDVVIPCGVYTHKNDKRKSLQAFIQLLQQLYLDQSNFKV
ncbi:MAG: LysR family transcriptional regulator [Selenomonas sp.]|uniref:LysR family transcriptional regulator n=1 Tax=Selenomonas sp. TaxID=2053611 RepID=UPI0025D5E4EC|nr:LysR family transcriptional regulator [Selenomonas sp.]MCR5757857.1 LysR family transcriptional regulator [Selenomonas sp.]